MKFLRVQNASFSVTIVNIFIASIRIFAEKCIRDLKYSKNAIRKEISYRSEEQVCGVSCRVRTKSKGLVYPLVLNSSKTDITNGGLWYSSRDSSNSQMSSVETERGTNILERMERVGKTKILRENIYFQIVENHEWKTSSSLLVFGNVRELSSDFP